MSPLCQKKYAQNMVHNMPQNMPIFWRQMNTHRTRNMPQNMPRNMQIIWASCPKYANNMAHNMPILGYIPIMPKYAHNMAQILPYWMIVPCPRFNMPKKYAPNMSILEPPPYERSFFYRRFEC